jgi:sensor histidine kinase YesM
MTMHKLIFSNDKPIRWGRHLIFWLSWFFYLSCTQLRNQTPDEIGIKSFIIYQFGVSANRILLQMLFCYPFIYFVIPRFLSNKKYFKFSILTALFLFALYLLTYYDYIFIWSDRSSPLFFDIPNIKPLSLFQSNYFAIYSNIHCTGTFVVLSIILTIKYYKNWFNKQRENEMLIFQNAQAELQLLKAQVHPHFLFNTLNNIYSLMLDDSPRTLTVLNELSGMTLYMTREGTDPLVALDKEIKMLTDYIGLEKIRYGERLEISVDVKLDQEDKLFIAPLLMIPFVENSFKHGASNSIDKAVINLHISNEGQWLKFKISNSVFPINQIDNERIKIGLKNVKKRLQILYPQKHSLSLQSENKIFTVNLSVYLGKSISGPGTRNFLTTPPNSAYA